jgi:hypothetical protein
VVRYQRFGETYCLHLQGWAAGIVDGLSPTVNMTQEDVKTKIKANQSIFSDISVKSDKLVVSVESSKDSTHQ